jgi:hypothetical protein
MYKAIVRSMIRRNISRLNEGHYEPALAMFRDDATLAFPGNNSFSSQHGTAERGRQAFVTHRGRVQIEAFLWRNVDAGIELMVDDILVNGPPWNTRVAIRVHEWIEGPEGHDRYNNRAVLFVNTAWGMIRAQEDYLDTERIADLDAISERSSALPTRPSVR